MLIYTYISIIYIYIYILNNVRIIASKEMEGMKANTRPVIPFNRL